MGRVGRGVKNFLRKQRNRHILLGAYLIAGSSVIMFASAEAAFVFSTIILSFAIAYFLFAVFFERKKPDLETELIHAMKELTRGNYHTPIDCNAKGTKTDMFLELENLRYQLFAGRENEAAFQEKTKSMLANVAHDLKTPLSVIAACAECIKDGLQDQDYPAIIEVQIAEMNALVSDIIENTRAELEALPAHKTATNFRTYFEGVQKTLKNLAENSARKLTVKKAPAVPVLMEPRQITRVFENIVGNAVKFTKERDKIAISFSKTKKRLYATVADTGTGIKKEDIPHVFDRFFRAEKARNTKGTGLGLAISKEIVEAHGGKIVCESGKRRGGTKFTFFLPLCPLEKQKKRKPEKQKKPKKKERERNKIA